MSETNQNLDKSLKNPPDYSNDLFANADELDYDPNPSELRQVECATKDLELMIEGLFRECTEEESHMDIHTDKIKVT